MPENVAMYGGFVGTETARSQRDWVRKNDVLWYFFGFCGCLIFGLC